MGLKEACVLPTAGGIEAAALHTDEKDGPVSLQALRLWERIARERGVQAP